jgi:hypothetical protein
LRGFSTHCSPFRALGGASREHAVSGTLEVGGGLDVFAALPFGSRLNWRGAVAMNL